MSIPPIYYNILMLIKINPRRIPVNGKTALAQFDLRSTSNGPLPNPGRKSLDFINFFRMSVEIHALKKTKTYGVINPPIYLLNQPMLFISRICHLILMKKTTVIINNIIRVNTLHIFLIHAFFFDKKIPRIDNNIRDNKKHNTTVILPEAVSS